MLFAPASLPAAPLADDETKGPEPLYELVTDTHLFQLILLTHEQRIAARRFFARRSAQASVLLSSLVSVLSLLSLPIALVCFRVLFLQA